MPAASSGASRPLSAASTASLRTAVMRTLIETEPRLRASSAPSRHLRFFDRRMTMAIYEFINSTRPEFVRRSAWDKAPQSGWCCVLILRTSSQKSSRLV
jgi:hypothetical protein